MASTTLICPSLSRPGTVRQAGALVSSRTIEVTGMILMGTVEDALRYVRLSALSSCASGSGSTSRRVAPSSNSLRRIRSALCANAYDAWIISAVC